MKCNTYVLYLGQNNYTMEVPQFLLADNTDYPNAVFVIHTAYPRFIINLEDDAVTWLEEFSKADEETLATEAERLIIAAQAFYDREVLRYKE